MKKLLLTTSFFVSLASASAFAHHPAADIVDPEIYAMIDENVADTPHADLTFDDMGGMGRDMDDVEAAMSGRDDVSPANDAAALRDEASSMGDDVAMDTDAAMETIDLLQNIDTAFAE